MDKSSHHNWVVSIRAVIAAQTALAVLIAPTASAWKFNENELALASKAHDVGGTVAFKERCAWLSLIPFRECASVDFHDADLSRTDIAFVKSMRGVTTFYAHNSNLNDNHLRDISACGTIQKLYLYNNRVTDCGLRAVARMNSVSHLGLSGNDITDDGIRTISGLPALSHLYVDRCEKLTDDSMRHLADSKNLVTLVISSKRLSDDGLRCLHNYSSLVELVACGTFSPVVARSLGSHATLRHIWICRFDQGCVFKSP